MTSFYNLFVTFKTYLEKIKMYSESTSRTYSSYEELFEKYNGDIKQIKLAHKSSNSTLRVTLSALKHYRDYKEMKKILIALPKKEIKSLKWVSYEEYITIMSSLQGKGEKKFEMSCIIQLLFQTGIRASELLGIEKNDIIDNKIKIRGKGNRERILTISSKLKLDLSNIKNNDRLFNFTYKNLYSRIRRLDIEKKYTPHMFRRGYAKYCYENKVSIYDLSLTMGHSNINTTSGYIKRSSEDIDISHLFS